MFCVGCILLPMARSYFDVSNVASFTFSHFTAHYVNMGILTASSGSCSLQHVLRQGVFTNTRNGVVWKYTPYTHKTEHLGKNRIIAVGPKAQVLLTPYLEAKANTPEAFLFSPKDAVQLQRIEKRKNRKSVGKNGQVQPSQKDRSKPDAVRTPGSQYSKNSYNRAINRACEKAGVKAWTANQLCQRSVKVVATHRAFLHYNGLNYFLNILRYLE